MDRTKMYKEVVIGANKELDFLNSPLSLFRLDHDEEYYMTNINDVARPDLISYENYGTVDYWWVICLVNGIENPLTDITVGMRLIIPSILDIDGFQRKYKKR